MAVNIKNQDLLTVLCSALFVVLLVLPLWLRFKKTLSVEGVSPAVRGVWNDLDQNGSADLLTFSRSSDEPIWRGFTLGGFEGALPDSSNVSGREFSWRVGHAQGVPVPGDYNGDGVLDLATFLPGHEARGLGETINWQVFLSDTQSHGESATVLRPTKALEFSWGAGNAVPVPADYDGDSKTDIAVYEPAMGLWHLLYAAGGFDVTKAILQIPRHGETLQWGLGGDVPVPGDYDGDGRADPAVWRAKPPLGGQSAEWLINFRKASVSPATIAFGRDGDIPVPADYDCDGVLDIGVFRPEDRSWHIRDAAGSEKVINWPGSGGEPLAADFDGDGCDDPAFFNPSGKYRFEILNSRFFPKLYDTFGFHPPVVTRLKWGDPKALPVWLWQRRIGSSQ